MLVDSIMYHYDRVNQQTQINWIANAESRIITNLCKKQNYHQLKIIPNRSQVGIPTTCSYACTVGDMKHCPVEYSNETVDYSAWILSNCNFMLF